MAKYKDYCQPNEGLAWEKDVMSDFCYFIYQGNVATSFYVTHILIE